MKERTHLLESYLEGPKWGYLEMFMLLAEDIVEFHVDQANEKTSMRLNDEGYPDLLVSLLISRCPVSQCWEGPWGGGGGGEGAYAFKKVLHRPISQTMFMLPIAINRAEHVCAPVIIKHNYILMCNHKIVINIMLCLLNSTGHK